MIPARKNATYEDVLAAPEHMLAQVVDGDLYLLPRPAKPHTLAASVLGGELGPPFHRGRGGPGGWFILFEPELHLGRDILVPDLAGWRRERMPFLDTKLPYFDLAPDWACEVLSPRTPCLPGACEAPEPQRFLDRTKKLAVYQREGVAHVWFVDPLERTLEIYAASSDGWRVSPAGGDEVVRAAPFDAIALELAALWADLVAP